MHDSLLLASYSHVMLLKGPTMIGDTDIRHCFGRAVMGLAYAL